MSSLSASNTGQASKSAEKALPLYSELPSSTSIRLLKLQPTRAAEPDEAICTLHVFELAKAPSFQALSYTWEPAREEESSSEVETLPEFTNSIRCDGHLIAITENLSDALPVLRDVANVEWTWIDAICINQQDNAERASQVLLMGNIYSTATEVIIWLGKDTTGLEDLLWGIDYLLPVLKSVNERQGSYYAPTLVVDSSYHEALGTEDTLHKLVGMAQFCYVCRRFSRAWVIQEVALARRVKVRCGQSEINWSKLKELGEVFALSGAAQMLMAEPTMSKILRVRQPFQELNALSTIERTLRKGKDPVGPAKTLELLQCHRTEATRDILVLFHLLSLTRTARSLDKRDTVYSILGIAARYSSRPVSFYVSPDYIASIVELFTSVTMLMLN